MKISFIASQPVDRMRWDRELAEILSALNGATVDYAFVPTASLVFEDLQAHVAAHRPQILHITAHGESERLTLTRQDGGVASIGAAYLREIFGKNPPQLVFLSACNSGEIAQQLVPIVPFVVSCSREINHREARHAAVSLYRALAQGSAIGPAYSLAREALKVLTDEVELLLSVAEGADAEREVLFRAPRLAVDFEDRFNARDGDGNCVLRLAAVDCPADVRQVVFFSDDESLMGDGETQETLAHVVRARPRDGVIRDERVWRTKFNIRFFAVVIDSSGNPSLLSTTLRDGLEELVSRLQGIKLQRSAKEAIESLRGN
jgi:hypothetical protein